MSSYLFGAQAVRGAFRRMVLGTALAGIVLGSALAGPAPAFSPDKRFVYLAGGQGQMHSSREHDTRLATIFSNFATKYPDGLYMFALGAAISGPKSLAGGTDWVAAPFTPAKTAAVMEIDVPVAYQLGTNSFVVNLFADGGGVPGTLIKSWLASKNDVKIGCCSVTAVKVSPGIAVTAGQQYWIALTTKAKDSLVSWDVNAVDNVDVVPYAFSTGHGWTASTTVPIMAFGVYGE